MIVVEKVKRNDVRCGKCDAPLTFTLIWENGKYSWTYECENCSSAQKQKKDLCEDMRDEFVKRLVRSW
ncbi:MAG: hypothetical protein QXX87_05595 [Candidatus Jordarchaeales archaeon]